MRTLEIGERIAVIAHERSSLPTLLSRETYAILRAWPLEWAPYADVVAAARATTGGSPASVGRRVAHLRTLDLIELAWRPWPGRRARRTTVTRRTAIAPGEERRP